MNAFARRARGMTIPEILIAVVVGAIVTAAGYKVFLRLSYQSRAQTAIAAAQSDLVAIQEALEKNLRRAMYNIPNKCPGLNAAGNPDTLRAIVIEDHGGSPDGITVRGNFSETASQLVASLPRGTQTMQVKPGDAKGFAAGDTVILRDAVNAEWCIVTAVNRSRDQIRTRARLFDFQIGADVIRAGGVSFRPQGPALTEQTAARNHFLTRNLEDLDFSAQRFDNTWVSAPPYDAADIQALQYAVKLRVPKPGRKGWLYRDASGIINLRNAR